VSAFIKIDRLSRAAVCRETSFGVAESISAITANPGSVGEKPLLPLLLPLVQVRFAGNRCYHCCYRMSRFGSRGTAVTIVGSRQEESQLMDLAGKCNATLTKLVDIRDIHQDKTAQPHVSISSVLSSKPRLFCQDHLFELDRASRWHSVRRSAPGS